MMSLFMIVLGIEVKFLRISIGSVFRVVMVSVNCMLLCEFYSRFVISVMKLVMFYIMV